MNQKPIRFIITLFACLAVLYPLWVRFGSLGWTLGPSILQSIFPALGLIAFAVLWLHVISGAFEPYLRTLFDFDRFVHRTSIIILICLILYPLLLLIDFDFNFSAVFAYGEKYILLAVIGWLLLITYDIGKALKRYNFFVRHWNAILLISTTGFILTFLHSLALGSDLQAGPLRAVWIFYGATAIPATVYNYGIKRFRQVR